MVATPRASEAFDNLTAELSDRAFQVAAQHGVHGNSVELELEIWQALGATVNRRSGRSRTAADRDAVEVCLARLTDTVYEIALEHGFQGSFLDLRLDLWRSLQDFTARKSVVC